LETGQETRKSSKSSIQGRNLELSEKKHVDKKKTFRYLIPTRGEMDIVNIPIKLI